VLFDREGRCKLSDFGLAKAQEPDPQFMTHGTTVGTPHYMAPEQARGEALDIRADLYALGATLYHAVTGRTPYSGSSAAVMQSHLRKELPPPRSVNPALSAGCCAIITKLMAKDRKARYSTPEAAAEDVARVLRNEPPHAIPAALPVPATRHAPAAAMTFQLPPAPPAAIPVPTPPGTPVSAGSGVVPAPPPPPARPAPPPPRPAPGPSAAPAKEPSPARPAPIQQGSARAAAAAPATHPAPANRQTTGRRRPAAQATLALTVVLWVAGVVVLGLLIRFLVAAPESAPVAPSPTAPAPGR
jgi:serine/threonine protein kinase